MLCLPRVHVHLGQIVHVLFNGINQDPPPFTEGVTYLTKVVVSQFTMITSVELDYIYTHLQ